MLYTITPETRAWALRLANNSRSPLTKGERGTLRRIAELDTVTAATADQLEREAYSLHYNAGLAYLDGGVARAKKLNKRADALAALARRMVANPIGAPRCEAA